jgi:predicted HAD superfamily phosphohydrolase YqeG
MMLFRELNPKLFSGSRILLDYGGTLCGVDGVVDSKTMDAITQLKNYATQVVVCSNQAPTPQRAEKLGLEWLTLDQPKPRIATAIAEFAQDRTKPIVVIGDSLAQDGALAVRLNVPFVHVQSLHKRGSFLDRVTTMFVKTEAFGNLIADKVVTVLYDAKRVESAAIEQIVLHARTNSFEVRVNPREDHYAGTVYIFNGKQFLEKAAARKQQGFVGRIIVGPDDELIPENDHALLSNTALDAIVFSSDQIKARWTAADQYFNRAEVVPLGVADHGARQPAAGQTGSCIVIASDVPEALFHGVMSELWKQQLSIEVSRAGTFKAQQYEKLLRTARCLIYLDTEGRGNFLLSQSWMSDVPTLCWKNPTIPPECGRSFEDVTDFSLALAEFLRHNSEYQPRQYAQSHVSATRSAAEYARIIRQTAGL